jgi:16S rRNA (guanine1516-N2)-methyltransferase
MLYGSRALVITSVPELQEKAAILAQTLALPYVLEPSHGLVLHVGSDRLELCEAGSKIGPVYVDFVELAKRPKQGKDLLAKAVGIKGSYVPTVIDATAGLGQDAFVLASYGCQVSMIERSPVIAALLQDGLERASELVEVSRLQLITGDAIKVLPLLPHKPEVIYLDPMYPESGKSAAKRKEMRFFRELVGDDLDIEELFEIALKTATKRVVLKRPLKAPKLGKPNTIYQGSTIRFDVYLTSSETKKSRA